MGNVKFYHVRYKKIKLVLGFSNYNFDYYAQYFDEYIVLILNRNLSYNIRSKILHKVIRCKKKIHCYNKSVGKQYDFPHFSHTSFR